MGFFKDFKNDMKQAVNELMPGNDEVAGEYDDEDMVNTLDDDPADASDEEYINTMDDDTAAGSDGNESDPSTMSGSEDDLDDIDLGDIEDFDMDSDDFDESGTGYASDMDSLADLLSGNIQIEDLENQEFPGASDQYEQDGEENVLLANSEQLEADYQEQLGSTEDYYSEAKDSVDGSIGSEDVYGDLDVASQGQQLDFLSELGIAEANTGTTAEQSEGHTDTESDESSLENELKDNGLSGNDLMENGLSDDQPGEDISVSNTLHDTGSEQGSKEDSAMSEDKVIDITSIKEPEQMAVPENQDPVKASLEAEGVSDSTTYITKGTRIEGNLFTDGSLDILGSVEGDVNCYGKLIISGSITGKVNAGEIYANAAKIEGEVTSAGSVKIGVGSVIVGNIDSQSAVIAGAVNGDLDVKGPVIVDSTAVIMGNIKSRSVQINNGAVIEGFCSQCYSDIDVKSFFA